MSPSSGASAFWKSPVLRTFGKNSLVQGGEQLINILLGLAITVYLARELGPSFFGIWSLCLALLRMAMTGVGYGLEIIIVRHCSGSSEPDESFLTSIIILRLFNSLIILAAVVMGVYLLPADYRTMANLTLVMMSALLLLPLEGLEFWFRAIKDAVTPAIARSVSVIVGSTLKAVLIASGAALVYLGAAHVLQMIIFAVLLLFFYRRRGHGFQIDRTTLRKVGEFYRSAWPLFVMTLGYLAYARIDIVMLSWIRGDHDAGTYAAAVRISEVFSLAPVIILTAASPFLFNGMRNNVKEFSGVFHVFLTLLNISFAGIAIAVCVLAPLMVHLLFGDSYSESAGYLAIHIFGIIFVAQGVATQYWWVARGRQNVVMWRALAAGVINIVLNSLLIPAYGGFGAAIATVVSQFFSCVGINVFLGRNGRYLFRQQIVPRFRLSYNIRLDTLVRTPGQALAGQGVQRK